MTKYRCQQCDREAVYVEVQPWITDDEPMTVHVICKPCGIAMEEAHHGACGYWFDITKWFEGPPDWNDPTRKYTMREHIRDTKSGAGEAIALITAALERQRMKVRTRQRTTTTTTTTLERKPKRRGLSARRRYAILLRDGFRCGSCGRSAELDGVALQVDHQQPLSKGGLDTDENLWTLCADCNQGKGASL